MVFVDAFCVFCQIFCAIVYTQQVVLPNGTSTLRSVISPVAYRRVASLGQFSSLFT